ncbi:glycosyltransferase family 2 protein [Bacteroidota bacterium]
MSESVKISGVVITYNEEKNIGQCLASLSEVVDEIIVVDSYSKDHTINICRDYNAKVVQRAFDGYIEQKNHAASLANFDYILSLDADEVLSEKMIREILKIKSNPGYDIYIFNRLNNYCGVWIRHGGWYPDQKKRLWKKNKAQWGGTNPHDMLIPEMDASIKHVKADIHHYGYESIEEHLSQINKFSDITARAKYHEGKKSNLFIHVILNPGFKFIKRYFFQLGFLDGYYGFVFCAIASLNNFLKYLRLFEYHRRGDI